MPITVEGPISGSGVDAQQRLETFTLVYKVYGLSEGESAARIEEAATAPGIPEMWKVVPWLDKTWVVAKNVRMLSGEFAEVTVTAVKPIFKPFVEFGTTLVQAMTDLDLAGDPMTIERTDANGNKHIQSVKVAKWTPKTLARIRIYRTEHPKELHGVAGKLWSGSILTNPAGGLPYMRTPAWLVWSVSASELVRSTVWDVTMEFLEDVPPKGHFPWYTSHYFTNPDGSAMVGADGKAIKAAVDKSPVYEPVPFAILGFLT